jgi:enoyl-CoA hydratase/carnithine racemase
MSVPTESFPVAFETLTTRQAGRVLFVDIAAPPMNLLGPELVRDLVSLIQHAEGDDGVQVLVRGGAGLGVGVGSAVGPFQPPGAT